MDSRNSRMERLIQIGRQLSAVADLERMLEAILLTAVDLTDSETASILEFDEENKNLRFLALPRSRRKSLTSILVPVDKSIAGRALREKKTVAENNAPNAPDFFKVADQLSGFHTHSLLATPVLFRGEPLGVIEVLNKSPAPDYTEDDVTILETLAGQAAVAIQNARLQRLLDKTKEEATRLEKMKNDFIAITSHELRTPLGLILGHATFLHEVIDVEHRPQLDIIVKNAMRLKDIIENMNSVDNVDAGTSILHRRTVSVRTLVEKVVRGLTPEVEQKNLTLATDMSASDLMIEGDGEKIEIAIANLIKNAVTFTDDGGHIFVLAEEIPGYVRLSVVDDGIGIPAEDLPHIFERFFQVESHLTRKHGGMGLGLAVTKTMIEMHGGRIWVESAEGRGSIFTMVLPLDSTRAEASSNVFID